MLAQPGGETQSCGNAVRPLGRGNSQGVEGGETRYVKMRLPTLCAIDMCLSWKGSFTHRFQNKSCLQCFALFDSSPALVYGQLCIQCLAFCNSSPALCCLLLAVGELGGDPGLLSCGILGFSILTLPHTGQRNSAPAACCERGPLHPGPGPGVGRRPAA